MNLAPISTPKDPCSPANIVGDERRRTTTLYTRLVSKEVFGIHCYSALGAYKGSQLKNGKISFFMSTIEIGSFTEAQYWTVCTVFGHAVTIYFGASSQHLYTVAYGYMGGMRPVYNLQRKNIMTAL